MHTNKNAEDFKINRSKNIHTNKWETFIPAKNETLIGSLTFLKIGLSDLKSPMP